MLWTDIKRVIRTGFISFWRNGAVSLSSILVMTITLFVLGSLMFLGVMLEDTLRQVESKVDVNVYFVPDAEEEDVLAVRQALLELSEVEEVAYISREEAIKNFEERHKNDQVILQGLRELEDNPLGARLNVVTKEVSQYESVQRFLEDRDALSPGGQNVISSTNYNENKTAIDKLTAIMEGSRQIGFAIMLVFAFISIVITFNTIRMAIYISREEISIMRLVGASNYYIRGPFVVEGALYGVVSGLFAAAIFYPVTMWMGNTTAEYFEGFSIFQYYILNFGPILLVLVGVGVLLGAISSYLAVRRYLKV